MITPMLATLTKEPFDDPEWMFEIKWDGYRALAYKEKKVKLFSRNAKLFNSRFALLVNELEKLPGTFVLDGEIVALDKQGVSQFQLLQDYAEKKASIFYYIFDVLSLNGKDLTKLPLIKRKNILRHLLKRKKWRYLRFSDHIEKVGKKLFEKAKENGLEGIIAKRKQSLYRFSRSKDWLKIKTKKRQEFVIGGFTAPKGSRKYFGALLLGVYEKQKLIYVGHVGTGFNDALLKEIHEKMLLLSSNQCPFKTLPKSKSQVTWLKPQLVCEAAFSEWTKDGILRQPVFKGLRVDKSPKDVMKEEFLTKKVKRKPKKVLH